MNRAPLSLWGPLALLAAGAVLLILARPERTTGPLESRERAGDDRTASPGRPREASLPKTEALRIPAASPSDPPAKILEGKAILRIAQEPSPSNVRSMLEAMFSQPRPSETIAEIVEALRAGELSFFEANAALIAIESALQVFHGEDWIRRFGAEDGFRLVGSLLDAFPDLAADGQERLLRVLKDRGYLGEGHLSGIQRLIARQPLPSGMDKLALAWAEKNPGAGVSFALSLLTEKNPLLRAAGIAFLIKQSPESYLGIAAEGAARAATDEEKTRLAFAIAGGLGRDRSLPVLRAIAAADMDKDASNPPLVYLPVIAATVQDAPVDLLRRELQAEESPTLREMIVGALRWPAHRELILGMAEGEEMADLRSQAVLTLSRYRPDERTAGLVLALIAGGEEGALRHGLSAAYNLSLHSRGKAWAEDLKAVLLDIVSEDTKPLSARRSALQAARALLNEDEKTQLLKGGLPEQVKGILKDDF